MHLGFRLSSVGRQTKCFPSDPNKLNLISSLKWTLDQFSSAHTTCSSAKVSLAFWFSLLMRGLVTAECVFRLLLNTPKQILTLFNTELASNSSCSAEPIPHWEPLHYPVFSCICLTWTTSLFGGLEWISVIVKLQITDLEWPTSLAVDKRVIPLAFISTTYCCWV